uniref:CCHC-type domain-containing protein n=1 Tax=Tanacetum cinerariifolium TaxID=118510 RepID=A0A6L2J460_TANCI|nr:hypothetical protein [Tanacetum cinerariifolium]
MLMEMDEMEMVEMMVTIMDALTRSSWHVSQETLMEKEVRGSEAALGMTWEEFKALLIEEFCLSNEMEKLEYIYGLVPQIHGMIRVTQPTIIQSAILKAGALTDEAVRYGTFSKSSEKRKDVEEPSKQRGTWTENKRAKVGKGFVVAGPARNEYAGSHPRCAKYYAYHPKGRPCRLCYNCQKPGRIRVCYECGSPDHFHNTCPKLNRAPGQVGNRLTIEENQNLRNNGNQTRGKAFNGHTVEDHQDPNVVTGTFSLSDHFAMKTHQGYFILYKKPSHHPLLSFLAVSRLLWPTFGQLPPTQPLYTTIPTSIAATTTFTPPLPAAVAAAHLTTIKTATPSPCHQPPHHHRSSSPSQPFPRCHHHRAPPAASPSPPRSHHYHFDAVGVVTIQGRGLVNTGLV